MKTTRREAISCRRRCFSADCFCCLSSKWPARICRSGSTSSNIVIIACNSDGEILDGRMMQGMTILSRFRPMEDIVGRTIYRLHEEYTALPEKRRAHYKGHMQALEALMTRLQPAEEPDPA